MNLDTISDKDLQQLERLLGEILVIISQAKLQNEPEADTLRRLHVQMGDIRCARFDAVTSGYIGY